MANRYAKAETERGEIAAGVVHLSTGWAAILFHGDEVVIDLKPVTSPEDGEAYLSQEATSRFGISKLPWVVDGMA